jgi:hypothetical protein
MDEIVAFGLISQEMSDVLVDYVQSNSIIFKIPLTFDRKISAVNVCITKSCTSQAKPTVADTDIQDVRGFVYWQE